MNIAVFFKAFFGTLSLGMRFSSSAANFPLAIVRNKGSSGSSLALTAPKAFNCSRTSSFVITRSPGTFFGNVPLNALDGLARIACFIPWAAGMM